MAYDATERTSNTKNIRSALKSIHRIPAVRRPLSSTPSFAPIDYDALYASQYNIHAVYKYSNYSTTEPIHFHLPLHSRSHQTYSHKHTQINTDRRNKNRTYWTEQKQKNNAHGSDASVSAHRRFSFIHTSHNVLRLLSSIHITSVYNTHNTHTHYTHGPI